ncbi:hypothetical protein QFZ76_005108 [Streptomyces sp. V4I2]|nr:hypothetical protein [Streptomyces sp. V4I2]
MIRHLVLFKLNEGVERDDPRVVKGVEAFRALDGRIPEIRFWELGWNPATAPSPMTSPSTPASTTWPRCAGTSSTRTTRRAWPSGTSSPPG